MHRRRGSAANLIIRRRATRRAADITISHIEAGDRGVINVSHGHSAIHAPEIAGISPDGGIEIKLTVACWRCKLKAWQMRASEVAQNYNGYSVSVAPSK